MSDFDAEVEIKSLENEVEDLKKEITRLKALIDDHNLGCICDKSSCGYAPYDRDCPNCPKYWRIDYEQRD